jgi:CRISPR/Cas system Type II protein with McrA/HNH and RuvC-like nuclease domain
MIDEIVSFFVPGFSRTKGSLAVVRAQPGRKAIVRESAKDSGTWRRLMAERARAAMAINGTVMIPKDVAALVHARYVFPGEDVLSQYIGDEDKLERNLLDALADAKVYANDRQVTHIVSSKSVSLAAGTHGVFVAVYAFSGDEFERRATAAYLADDLQAVIHRWRRPRTR